MNSTARAPATRALRRGYSLVVVLLTLGLVIVAITTLIAFLEVGTKTSADNIERRRMFYVCDGMTRIVARVLQDFMRTATLTPGEAGSAALRTYLNRADVGGGATLPLLVPDGFSLVVYNVSDYDHVGDTVAVPAGPFAGIPGSEDTLTLLIVAKRADGKFQCQTRQEISLTQIGMFQMALWSALPKTRVQFSTVGTDAVFAIDGRVHGQGELELVEGPTTAPAAGVLVVRSATAAGHIDGAGPAAAATVILGGAGATMPAPSLLTTTPRAVLDGRAFRGAIVDPNYSGWLTPTTTPPTPLGAQPADNATWLAATEAAGGGAADVRQGVTPLSLPLPVPTGGEGDPLHVLIEPVDADPAADERQRHKLAYKADIRIIDGVWYLADPVNRGNWPGTPIWSDHPGRATATFPRRAPIAVGQDDLRSARGWSTTPKRFSPYGFALNGSGQGEFAGKIGVPPSSGGGPFAVRYGQFAFGARADPSVAGFYAAGGSGLPPSPTHVGCQRADPLAPGDTAAQDIKTYYRTNDFFDLKSNCLGPWTPTSQYLESARMGFQDPQLTVARSEVALGALNPTATEASEGNILPLNFSVEGFLTALSTTTAGELGSYFRSRRFNGIVWISAGWTTQQATPRPMHPLEPVPVGARRPPVPVHYVPGVPGGSPSAPTASPRAAYPAVPYPLCSTSLAGTAYDDPAYRVHACDGAYYAVDATEAGDNAAHINAIRVVDADIVYSGSSGVSGRNLLSSGLTIASDLPAYLQGNANQRSSSSTPFAPLALAADNVALLPVVFSDAANPWWATHVSRQTVLSTPSDVHVAVLTGAAQPVGTCGAADGSCGDTVLSALRIVGNYSGVNTGVGVVGAVVVGYHARYVSVLFPQEKMEVTGGGEQAVVVPKSTRITFDPALNSLASQPPGTEALGIQSVRQWSRD